MIKKDELLQIHRNLGLPLSTVEKDYVLSLIIWGISQQKDLKVHLGYLKVVQH